MGQGITGAMVPTPAVMPSQDVQPFMGRGGPNAFPQGYSLQQGQGMPIQQAPLATAPPVDMQANNYTAANGIMPMATQYTHQPKPAGGAK